MDSGLGSDEDRRGRTKEQKQLRNQQLLSGCFIDAASLSDDADVDQRRNDERRQGALIFQSSIPQFSMLQMSGSDLDNNFSNNDSIASTFVETSTPYNSIVQIDSDDSARKSPLGFYVDLSEVPDIPKSAPPSSAKKNIFSMVIDFEAPKKEKPVSLSSSYVSHRKIKLSKQNGKNSDSLSGSGSSINSVPGPSREIEVPKTEASNNLCVAKCASSLSSSNEDFTAVGNDKNSGVLEKDIEEPKEENDVQPRFQQDETAEPLSFVHSNISLPEDHTEVEEEKNEVKGLPQFVKLSDLECQKTRLDLNLAPRMSRSIPESSWVESPLLMSRSAGYRSAPHPLEPENEEEMYDSFSTTETSSSQPRKSVRRLGTDLLRMFLEEIGPDVTIEVENHKIKAHKCILASRCQYFAAMLSGNWLEASGNVISLQGFSYESVYFSLCHIYSGAAHVPDSISVIELASLADMLGLEGLKEVVEHALRQRYCHNFHKPCAGCCTGVTEVLMLSAAYGLDDLYQKCLQWITQNFVKIWPSRGFSSLPRELREKCYQQHVVNMTPDRVLETKTACEKILATLPSSRWAEPIQQLAQQLVDACHLYHRQHYAAVLVSPSFIALDSGPSWCILQIDDQMTSAASNLGVDQACRSYSRCCKMLDQAWSRMFEDLLNKIKSTLEQCLVSQADRLIRSNAWLRLDSALRARIKDLTPTGESTSRLPRATPKKPKFNSSQNNQSSSDSSRNSSPGMLQNRLLNSGGSPSLRRSLLLAAKAPQVPPSPTINRRSTLTQPTAASAAKSTPSKTTTKVQSKIQLPKNTSQPQPRVFFQNRERSVNSRKPEVKTAVIKREAPKKADNRAHSPLKTDSRSSSPRKFDSRLSSPVKTVLRSSSPLKGDSRTSSPKKSCVIDKAPQNTSFKNNEVKRQQAKPTVIKKNASDSQLLPRTNLITQQRMMKHAVTLEKYKPPTPKVTRIQTRTTSSSTSVTQHINSSILKKNKSSNDVLLVKQKSSSPVTSISPDNEDIRYSPEGVMSPEEYNFNSSKVNSDSNEFEEYSRRGDSESQSNSENETFVKKYPAMQRSDTFLKEEPTVIGKLK